jgi:hypothetical protein
MQYNVFDSIAAMSVSMKFKTANLSYSGILVTFLTRMNYRIKSQDDYPKTKTKAPLRTGFN